MNRSLAINFEIAVLQERINVLLAEQRAILEQEWKQPERADKAKRNSLKLPKPQNPIDYEKIVSSIYEAFPETRGYNSKRLLAYIRDFGRQQNIVIDISDSRIRKLRVWKEQAPHRKSGNIRYGYNNPDDFPEEDDG